MAAPQRYLNVLGFPPPPHQRDTQTTTTTCSPSVRNRGYRNESFRNVSGAAGSVDQQLSAHRLTQAQKERVTDEQIRHGGNATPSRMGLPPFSLNSNPWRRAPQSRRAMSARARGFSLQRTPTALENPLPATMRTVMSTAFHLGQMSRSRRLSDFEGLYQIVGEEMKMFSNRRALNVPQNAENPPQQGQDVGTAGLVQ